LAPVPWPNDGLFATLAGRESALCAAFIGVAWMVSSAQYSLVRSILNAQTIAQSEDVARRLLSAMCDTVVHLDHDLVIQRPVPKLGALLLRSQTASSLQGLSFQDFLLDEYERGKFAHGLSQSAQLYTPCNHQNDTVAAVDDGHACSMPSRMRDAGGSVVHVQVFYSSFQPLGTNQFCHIIGVTEDVLEEWLVPRQSRNIRRCTGMPNGGSNGATMDATRAAADPFVDDNNPLPELSSAQLEKESHCSSACSSQPEPFATLVSVDVGSEDLRIVACSTSFAVLGGSSGPGLEIATWVRKQQCEPLAVWLQTAANILFHDHALPEQFMELVLRPPHLVRHSVWVKANIQVVGHSDDDASLEEGEELAEKDDNLVVQLKLCNLEWIQGSIAMRRWHEELPARQRQLQQPQTQGQHRQRL